MLVVGYWSFDVLEKCCIYAIKWGVVLLLVV